MAEELKQKLDSARNYASLQHDVPNSKTKQKEEFVLLTRTSSKGYSYPVKQAQGNKNESKKRKEKVLTHEDGKRVRYFDDDDKYSLKSMVCVLKSTFSVFYTTFCTYNCIYHFSLKKK